MSYFIMPTPEQAHCIEPCAHRDCLASKEMFATKCLFCGLLPIPGQTVCFNDDGTVSHFACIVADSDAFNYDAEVTDRIFSGDSLHGKR